MQVPFYDEVIEYPVSNRLIQGDDGVLQGKRFRATSIQLYPSGVQLRGRGLRLS
jgi:hypothetical protein